MGYLWLLVLWLWFGDAVPQQAPPGGGLVANLFELSGILGVSITLAAASFAAYVLGAITTVSTDRGIVGRLLGRGPFISSDAQATQDEVDILLHQTFDDIRKTARSMSTSEVDALERDLLRMAVKGPTGLLGKFLARRRNEGRGGKLARGRFLARAIATEVDSDEDYVRGAWVEDALISKSMSELRPRLLVAKPDLYGEYDRLAAESQFRLNLCLPLTALGITAATEVSLWFLAGTVIVVALLVGQGMQLHAEAESVIRRAILDDVIKHPLESVKDRIVKPVRTVDRSDNVGHDKRRSVARDDLMGGLADSDDSGTGLSLGWAGTTQYSPATPSRKGSKREDLERWEAELQQREARVHEKRAELESKEAQLWNREAELQRSATKEAPQEQVNLESSEDERTTHPRETARDGRDGTSYGS